MLTKFQNIFGPLLFLLVCHAAYFAYQTPEEQKRILTEAQEKKTGKTGDREKVSDKKAQTDGVKPEEQLSEPESNAGEPDASDKNSPKKQEPRRRIVTENYVKQETSGFGDFLMKPFKAIAPGVTKTITILEEDRQFLWLFGPSDSLITPVFGGVADGSGFGAGFAVSTKDYLSKDFRLHGSSLVTTKGYVRNKVGFEVTPQSFKEKKLTIRLIGQQLLLADEDFYGIGPGSFRSDETGYYHRQYGAKLSVDFQANKDLKFGAFTEFTRNDLTTGTDSDIDITDQYDSITLPGFDRNIRLLDSGAFIETQRVDVSDNPQSGWFARYSVSNVDSYGRHDFGWINHKIDARAYIPLGNKLRVIALRLLGDFKDVKGNTAVPFFRFAKLGSSETLRGYNSNRFQGINSLHLNTEYRFKLAQAFRKEGFTKLEGFLFGDFGQVFNTREELTSRNMKATWGGGFRLASDTSVVFTIMYAQSPETGRLLWSFGRSF